jgi:hypothetical protein
MQAVYMNKTGTLQVPNIWVRFRPKTLEVAGVLPGGEYAQMPNTDDIIVFDVDDLTSNGFTPARGDTIAISAFPTDVFKLDHAIPADQPGSVPWRVLRSNTADL